MSNTTKQINKFFKTAIRPEIQQLFDSLALSSELRTIAEMRYIEGKDLGYIADMTNCSKSKIDKDLSRIRAKISKLHNYPGGE